MYAQEKRSFGGHLKFKTTKEASCKQRKLRSACAFLFVSFYILLLFGIESNECNASTFRFVNFNIKEITQRAYDVKRRCTGVDATSSRRIDVSPTSFQRHVPAEGPDGMNLRPACGSYTETKTVRLSFGCVVCWLLDAHFIVGTACMVQQYILLLFLSLTEKNQA